MCLRWELALWVPLLCRQNKVKQIYPRGSIEDRKWMKSKWTVFLKRAGSVRWLEPTASGCLGKCVFILHAITRASVFAYRAGERCWMKAYHMLNGSLSEWAEGSACLPFSPFFFPFFSDVVISENISNWRESLWEMTSDAPNAPLSKYTWKTFFASLCPTSYLHFQSPKESAKNTDNYHLDWGPPVTQSRLVSSH